MVDEQSEATDYLRVEIDAGPDFEPSPRLVAALEELGAAIEEGLEPEVAGFSLFNSFLKADGWMAAGPAPGGLAFKFDSRGAGPVSIMHDVTKTTPEM
jgi:hypothetical protein